MPVERVISTNSRSGGSTHSQRPSWHPVIFDRAVFSELRTADHAVGAKAVVHAHLTDAVELTVDSEGSFLDIDTPVDYMRAFNSAPPEETDR